MTIQISKETSSRWGHLKPGILTSKTSLFMRFQVLVNCRSLFHLHSFKIHANLFSNEQQSCKQNVLICSQVAFNLAALYLSFFLLLGCSWVPHGLSVLSERGEWDSEGFLSHLHLPCGQYGVQAQTWAHMQQVMMTLHIPTCTHQWWSSNIILYTTIHIKKKKNV